MAKKKKINFKDRLYNHMDTAMSECTLHRSDPYAIGKSLIQCIEEDLTRMLEQRKRDTLKWQNGNGYSQ